MLNIKNRIFVQLKIDGSDIPEAPNLVSRIVTTEGMGALSPAIELVLNDYSGILNRELALTDGNEILLTVGKAPEDATTQSRQYRLFGSRQPTSATGPQIRAIGIYDAPGYLTGSVRESFEGNTTDVLTEIAKRCKLTFRGGQGAATEDKQIWLNVCKSRAMFVQETIRHARIDDSSAMMAMLTSRGELRYYNMSEVIETPKEKIHRMFVHNTEQKADSNMVVYQVRDARDSSVAGLMNTWQNYGSTRVAHSLSGTQELYEKLDVKTASGYLPINEQVAKTVAKSRIDYSALDCGNNHKNYYRALYQNIRLLALFSEHVSLLTVDITDVELMDVVIYRQANADPALPVNKSDIYVVIGKTIIVKGGMHYGERIELVRRSLSTKGEAQLAGSDISSNAASADPTPESLIDPTVTPSVASLPQVKGLTGAVNVAQGKMDQVKVALPAQTEALTSVLPRMKAVSDAVKSGTPAQLLSGVNNLAPAMSLFGLASGNVNQMLAATLGPIGALATATLGQATGVRQAVLTNPGGILSSMTASMSATKQQASVASAMSALNAALKLQAPTLSGTPEGAEALSKMNAIGQAATTTANASSATTAGLWNTSTSILSGVPIPSTIKPQLVSPLQTTLIDLHAPGPAGSPLTLSRQTQAVTNVLSSKTEDKKPQWVSPDPLTIEPAQDVDASLSQMEIDLKSVRRREQDMYSTDWTVA